jgi:hypothetical protein
VSNRYERGDYSYGERSFTESATGGALRVTRIQGHKTAINGVPHKTTKTVTVTDERGNTAEETQYVCTGATTFDLLSSTFYSYSEHGALTNRTVNGASVYDARYEERRLLWEMGETGEETEYKYGVLSVSVHDRFRGPLYIG